MWCTRRGRAQACPYVRRMMFVGMLHAKARFDTQPACNNGCLDESCEGLEGGMRFIRSRGRRFNG